MGKQARRKQATKPSKTTTVLPPGEPGLTSNLGIDGIKWFDAEGNELDAEGNELDPMDCIEANQHLRIRLAMRTAEVQRLEQDCVGMQKVNHKLLERIGELQHNRDRAIDAIGIVLSDTDDDSTDDPDDSEIKAAFDQRVKEVTAYLRSEINFQQTDNECKTAEIEHLTQRCSELREELNAKEEEMVRVRQAEQEEHAQAMELQLSMNRLHVEKLQLAEQMVTVAEAEAERLRSVQQADVESEAVPDVATFQGALSRLTAQLNEAAVRLEDAETELKETRIALQQEQRNAKCERMSHKEKIARRDVGAREFMQSLAKEHEFIQQLEAMLHQMEERMGQLDGRATSPGLVECR